MDRSNSLKRKTLHAEVVEQLRRMILDGELAPGEKIQEPALCQRFEISRTPLREALKVLAGQGMIQLLPQRGARVAVLDQSELNELFPIIASLEALAGELACANLTDQDIARIQAMHDDMLAAYRQDNHLVYSRLNRGIHMAIFDAAANSALTALYLTLEQRIHSIRHTARQHPEDWRTAVADHERILAAVRARNSQALSHTLKEHVLHTADMVRHAMFAPEAEASS